MSTSQGEPPAFQVASVQFVWTPPRDAGLGKVEVRAFNPTGVPLMLADHQKMFLLDQFQEQTQPGAKAAAQGFAMISQLLAFAVNRLEVDGQPVAHPDGDPVVNENWLHAAKDMLAP